MFSAIINLNKANYFVPTESSLCFSSKPLYYKMVYTFHLKAGVPASEPILVKSNFMNFGFQYFSYLIQLLLFHMQPDFT